MKTELLYHRDPLLFDVDATVTAHATWQGAPSVILDVTAFYPEGGGQLADRGTLAGTPVKDVQIDDEGRVHHLLDGPQPQVGARVSCRIDRARRRQFMAQHTAQHMLSRALLDVAKAETVSARLGESVSTIDVGVAGLAERALLEAEGIVNGAVDDDLAVRAWFPSEHELRALPLRRQPKVAENVRVIEVAGFDVSPCGGTHCTHTAQIGLVRVVGVERYKGMMRVSFLAGAQARTQAFSRARTLEEMARSMSSSPDEVPAALDKLRAELKAAHEEIGGLLERLAQAWAAEQASLHAAPGPVVATLEGGPRVLRAAAAALCERHRRDAVLASPVDDGVAVLLMRAAGSTLDCGAELKRIAALAGGKGGGRPERAEGRLPAGSELVTLWPCRT